MHRTVCLRPHGRAILGAAAWLVLSTVAQAQALSADDDSGGGILIRNCLVSLIHDIKVPAQEAGVLVALEAREGLLVEAGAVVARINDSQPQAQRRVAVAEHQVAHKRASDDVEIRLAQATAQVAEVEYRLNRSANDKVPGARAATELHRLQLAHHRAELAAEHAEHQQAVALLEADARAAQVDAADTDIERRHIKAPISGEVIEVYPHIGEWVKPGDAVLRLVRLDRLRIEGFVSAAAHSPDELAGRAVLVEVRLARGRSEQLAGKIVFVSPLVQAGGDYRVRAEVVNRYENEHWLLRPGRSVDMLVQPPAGPLARQPGDRAAR